MPLMRSISNHFYNGQTRPAGGKPYEVADKDVELLVTLKRAVRVDEEEAAQSYKTRELQAEQPQSGVISSRGVIPPEQVAQRAPRSRRAGGTPPDNT